MNQLERYISEADALSKQTPTPASRQRLAFLLSGISKMKIEFPATESRANGNDEQRKAEQFEKDFESYLRTGQLSFIPAEQRAFINENKISVRTYQPETSQTAAVYIPQQWAGVYLDRLKSFVGIRAAGASVVTTKTGGAWKYPFSDDTANDGERLNET